MVKVKVSELTGPALDWAVAKCNGVALVLAPFTGAKNFVILGQNMKPTSSAYTPSTSWAQAGPIIEREFITVGPYHDKAGRPTGVFQAYIGWGVEQLEPLFQCDGPTPLIASMRCYVASKLGDTIEVPAELV